MKLRVHTAESLVGEVRAPSSKSYTHRAILVGALSGRATVRFPLRCDDTYQTLMAVKQLGAHVDEQGDTLSITGVPNPLPGEQIAVSVGESGTLLRFILPLLSAMRAKAVVTGHGSIQRRPNTAVVEALRTWGVSIAGEGPEHCAPLTIDARQQAAPSHTVFSGGTSSQVVSGLLIAAPLRNAESVLSVRGRQVSRPYIDITLDVLEKAGIHVSRRGYRHFRISADQSYPREFAFDVPGDHSSGAFLLAAAALTKSDVLVRNLHDDAQGDKRIITLLKRMGARILREDDGLRVAGPFTLKGIEADCSDVPDLVPILTVLGCFAKGTTVLKNIAHLAYKESNRLSAPARELRRMGARVHVEDTRIVVEQSRLKSAEVSAHNDHRIAMALATAGLAIAGGVLIDGAECIAKSYPDYVAHLQSLQAPMELV